MQKKSSPGSDLVGRTLAGPTVSKYDLVAIAIPAAYIAAVGGALAAGAPARLGLLAASLVGVGVMGYALFFDPPVDPPGESGGAVHTDGGDGGVAGRPERS